MTRGVLSVSVEAENDDSIHQARLLLLLASVSSRRDGALQGITKLAKLDFLLRYPTYLTRLLPLLYKNPPSVPAADYEADTVESRMIRYRYGPWDPRYRRWLSLLVARGLLDTYLQGRTVQLRLTERGREVASQISEMPEYTLLRDRSILLGRIAGKTSGTKLKNLVYEIAPELSGMSWGEEILP